MCKSKLTFFIYLLVIVALFSIKCDNPDQFEIPSVYLDFSINVYTDVEFMLLRSAGNATEIHNYTIGVPSLGYDNNGIILFNNGDEFYAFDRTCTFDFPNSIAVDLKGGSIAVCPKCGSKYVLPSIGMPDVDGPATHSLKEYRTYFNPNTGDVRVYN